MMRKTEKLDIMIAILIIVLSVVSVAGIIEIEKIINNNSTQISNEKPS